MRHVNSVNWSPNSSLSTYVYNSMTRMSYSKLHIWKMYIYFLKFRHLLAYEVTPKSTKAHFFVRSRWRSGEHCARRP